MASTIQVRVDDDLKGISCKWISIRDKKDK